MWNQIPYHAPMIKITVRDVVRWAGGPRKLAKASERTLKPISEAAVMKWYRAGIPDEHWGLVMRECDGKVTVEQLYAANQKLLRKRTRRARPRPAAPLASAAA